MAEATTCQTCQDTIEQTPAGWQSTREGIPDPLACWYAKGALAMPHNPVGREYEDAYYTADRPRTYHSDRLGAVTIPEE